MTTAVVLRCADCGALLDSYEKDSKRPYVAHECPQQRKANRAAADRFACIGNGLFVRVGKAKR